MYASPYEGCIYSSLADPNIGAPLLLYFVAVFKKYGIFIPIEIYETLSDLRYASRKSNPKFQGLVRSFSKKCRDFYENDFYGYYKPFEKLVRGLEYRNPMLLPKEPDPMELFKRREAEAGRVSDKNRLFLGEADLSFSRAFFEKHSEKRSLPCKSIITEYASESAMYHYHRERFKENVDHLRSLGADVQFGIDARRIHEYFSDSTFKRIHFNFPHDRSRFQTRSLPQMLDAFFRSASCLQEVGHKIYIALPKLPDQGKEDFYQAYVYKIYDAAANGGYKLYKKREFGGDRYPGYAHTKTNERGSASVTEDAREYVFIKIEQTTRDQMVYLHGSEERTRVGELIVNYKSPGEGREREFYKRRPHHDTGHILPSIKTESDSSTISSDEEDFAELSL